MCCLCLYSPKRRHPSDLPGTNLQSSIYQKAQPAKVLPCLCSHEFVQYSVRRVSNVSWCSHSSPSGTCPVYSKDTKQTEKKWSGDPLLMHDIARRASRDRFLELPPASAMHGRHHTKAGRSATTRRKGGVTRQSAISANRSFVTFCDVRRGEKPRSAARGDSRLGSPR